MSLHNNLSSSKAGIVEPKGQPSLKTLKKIAASINDTPLLNSLNELSEKLASNLFYLVIVGSSKRGKSSLINALIGKELAPVAVTPLTSVITFFEYSVETKAEVFFVDGRIKNIPMQEVVQYVSEEENPVNKKGVQSLKIYTNASILENIVLIDTPGIGSLFSHNSDTTLQFLPRIDAALFVLSADIPISRTDEEFLLQMKKSIPNILFVLNKMDLLSPPELDKIVKYNRESLRKIFDNRKSDFELVPVSAREFFQGKQKNSTPTNGNIKLLHDLIDKKIIGAKDEILTTQSARQLMALTNQLDTLLTVKFDTLQLPVHELEKKRASMQQSFQFMASGKDDFEAVIKNRVDQLKERVAEESERMRIDLEQYCHRLLKVETVKTWQQIRETDADIFYHQTLDYITQQYDELKRRLEKMVKEDFETILRQYSRQSQSFLNEIVRQMEEILGIHIEGIISTFDLDIYTSFYIYKSDIKYTIPSIKEKISYKILPDKWVRRKLLKQIYDNCMIVVNPNAGRIRSDIDYKISESFRKFKSNFNQKLQELLESLRNMIDESIRSKQHLHENMEDMLDKIRKQKQQLESIRKFFEPIIEEPAQGSNFEQ